MKTNILYVLSALILFSACEKEEPITENNVTTGSSSSLIHDDDYKVWYLEDVSLGGFSQMDQGSCYEGTVMTFYSDGTLTNLDGCNDLVERDYLLEDSLIILQNPTDTFQIKYITTDSLFLSGMTEISVLINGIPIEGSETEVEINFALSSHVKEN